MEINFELLSAILDAYPYQVVFCDRQHIIRYMNKAAHQLYDGTIGVGDSIFNCHNQDSCRKIEAFLARADAGEGEMPGGGQPPEGRTGVFHPRPRQRGEGHRLL